jgi:cyanophycinase
VFHESLGPEKGALLLGGGGVGGGMSDEMWRLFFEHAGGENARLVIIPTSWGENSINYDPSFSILKEKFGKRGFRDVVVLHTRDRNEANTRAFAKPLKDATAVWFTGGRQWRTIDVYLDTRTHKELIKVLERGGIIGGQSAGASVQGSFLARGCRDENGSYSITGGQEIGFGFIKNTAIDQHHVQRNRHYDMFEILQNDPGILGIGVDESTAILLKNNQFEVIGERYVTIYDGTFWSPYFNLVDTLEAGEEKFYFLGNGTRYDIKQRRVISNKVLEHQALDSINFVDYVGKYQLGEGRQWYNTYIQHDTLFVQRTMGPNINPPIAIFPSERDTFFDRNSIWWYRFNRNVDGQVVEMIRDDNKSINGRSCVLRKLEN